MKIILFILFNLLFISLSKHTEDLLITTTIDGGITARRISDGEVMWTTTYGGPLLETHFQENYYIIPSIDKTKSLFAFSKEDRMLKRLPYSIEKLHSLSPTLLENNMVTCEKTYNTFSIDIIDGVKYPITNEKGYILFTRNDYHLHGIDILSGFELWKMKYSEFKLVQNLNKKQRNTKIEYYVLINPSNKILQIFDNNHIHLRTIHLDESAIVNAFIYSYETEEVYEIHHEYMMYSDDVVVNHYLHNLYAIILSSSSMDKDKYQINHIPTNNVQQLLTYIGQNLSENNNQKTQTTTSGYPSQIEYNNNEDNDDGNKEGSLISIQDKINKPIDYPPSNPIVIKKMISKILVIQQKKSNNISEQTIKLKNKKKKNIYHERNPN